MRRIAVITAAALTAVGTAAAPASAATVAHARCADAAPQGVAAAARERFGPVLLNGSWDH
jgi:hypothetical protein